MVYDDKKFSTVGAANTIFQWEDVIAGVGYKTFSALVNNEGAALITSSQSSNDYKTDKNVNAEEEINFDYEFLAGADIGGEGYINITLRRAASDATVLCDVRLIHVDTAAAETELVATLTTDQLSGGAATDSRRVSITMAIPETHFSIGEKIRLEITLKVTALGSGLGGIYHDPANRGTTGNDIITGSPARTDLTLTIPFRLPV